VNIVLFGIKGCGKTTLGKKIAKKLNRAFIDTDAIVEELYHLSRGQKISCPEIFNEVGLEGFRYLEQEAVHSLQDVQSSVIAVGGGAMTNLENVEALNKSSALFYLILEKELLKKRVLSQDELPVFLNPNDPDSSFDQMYEERNDYYRKLGAHHVDITKMEDEQVINSICSSFDEIVKKKKLHGK